MIHLGETVDMWLATCVFQQQAPGSHSGLMGGPLLYHAYVGCIRVPYGLRIKPNKKMSCPQSSQQIYIVGKAEVSIRWNWRIFRCIYIYIKLYIYIPKSEIGLLSQLMTAITIVISIKKPVSCIPKCRNRILDLARLLTYGYNVKCPLRNPTSKNQFTTTLEELYIII